MVLYLKTKSGDFIKASFGKGSALNDIYELYRHDADEFAAQQLQIVGPENLLYVCQRELALVRSDGPVSLLGSEDATTCHLVILRDDSNLSTLLAHCDGSDTKGNVHQMISKVVGISKNVKRLKLYLIGGFSDDRNISTALSEDMLRYFHQSQIDIELHLACICRLNNIVKDDKINYPKVYGIAVDVKNGKVFPATFKAHGPCIPVRSCNSHSSLLDIYDCDKNKLIISPFRYDDRIQYAEYVLSQSDAFIRQNMSTSPQVEPPGFEKHIRDSLQFVIDNPSSEIFFKKNLLHYSLDQAGLWQICEKNTF